MCRKLNFLLWDRIILRCVWGKRATEGSPLLIYLSQGVCIFLTFSLSPSLPHPFLILMPPPPLCYWNIFDIQQYKYQVYNIVIDINYHNSRSSYHMSAFKDIIILLTIFPELFISSLWLIYFITGSLYLLIILTCFTHSHLFLSALATCLFSVSMSLVLSIHLFGF